MKPHTLKVDELCNLVKVCKESGVTEFKLGELQISFRPHATVEQAPQASQPSETEVNQVTEKQDTKLTLERNRLEDDKEKSADLLIDDPFEMEQRFARGDLIGSESA